MLSISDAASQNLRIRGLKGLHSFLENFKVYIKMD